MREGPETSEAQFEECSFCGKPRGAGKFLMRSKRVVNVSICEQCVLGKYEKMQTLNRIWPDAAERFGAGQEETC